MCVLSKHLAVRGPEITVKQRYRLKRKLLQICQTAERNDSAFHRSVLTVCSKGSHKSLFCFFLLFVTSNHQLFDLLLDQFTLSLMISKCDVEIMQIKLFKGQLMRFRIKHVMFLSGSFETRSWKHLQVFGLFLIRKNCRCNCVTLLALALCLFTVINLPSFGSGDHQNFGSVCQVLY